MKGLFLRNTECVSGYILGIELIISQAKFHFENDPMLIFKFYMRNFHAILYQNPSSII
jgi:hypothetical protein